MRYYNFKGLALVFIWTLTNKEIAMKLIYLQINENNVINVQPVPHALRLSPPFLSFYLH
jgi:hypothetical protein